MNKLRQSWLIIDILFLLIFLVVYFGVFGFAHPATVWIDLLFVLLAHAGFFLTGLTLPLSKNSGHLSGASMMVCVAYMALTTVVAVVFSLCKLYSVALTAVTQAVLFLLALAFWLASRSMTQHTVQLERQQQAEALFGDQLMRAVLGLQAQANGDEIKQRCGRLMDAAKAMPARSSPAVADIEQTILQALSEACTDGTGESKQIEKLDMALSQITLRNNMLKAI